MPMGVLRTKSIEQSIRDTEESEHKLRKDLSAWDLTVFGIGVIIGTGIFVLTGIAAATKAGPAVSLSFVLAGIACALAALCYAEFASTVPVAGSAYTFSYASLGELIAWIIGWDLVLEFALGPRRCRSAGPSTSPRSSRSPSRSRARARSTSPPGRSCSS
jgi:APA family basic amino acid/polyamine antiporter